MEQSCARRRIEWSNPVLGAGLTERRLRRRYSENRALRRWPAPGPHQARTRPAPGPHQARTRVFSGKIGSLERSRNSDLGGWNSGLAFRPKPRSRPRFQTEAAEPASLSDRSRGAGLAFRPKPRSRPRFSKYESLCHGATRTVGHLGGSSASSSLIFFIYTN